MRLMYSFTTGSLTNFADFSTWAAYWRPILISDSTEYQFPTPRPPISRVPTALTSSILPGLILGGLGSLVLWPLAPGGANSAEVRNRTSSAAGHASRRVRVSRRSDSASPPGLAQ